MVGRAIRKCAQPLLLLAAAVHVSNGAFAQSGDPAAAEALFAAGRAAFDSGDYDSACAKFAESQRLDPAAGTLINLAACNERRGRLASAWENWREALSMLRSDDERLPGVERRKADLEARLPRLDVRVAQGAPAGVEVSRDGVALGPAALGLPLPIDPGPHRIEVTAPGRVPRVYEVEAVEGRVTELVVQAGDPFLTPQPAATAPPTEAPPKKDGNDTLRFVGYAVAGVGLVSVGTGAVTGLLALDRKNTIEETCEKNGESYACPPDGVDAANSGETLATVSTITTIAGLALVATGVTLVLTSSSDGPAVSATLGPSGGMLRAAGRF
jgi:tetratricopeptide (TPR) repeat protein